MHTVLVIDDDDCFHYLCTVLFTRATAEFNVLTARDGIEALEVLRTSEEEPGLILLDINMPRMNGHEFLAEFAKMSPRKIPVVAMLTNSDRKQDRLQALTYSFVKDYLVKPICKDDVSRLLTIYESLNQPAFQPAATTL